MKVIGIELENYGAFYGRHYFRYADRGLTMVLGENRDEPRMNSNGSAKSTLFEGLDWCWFGKVPKGDHADSIINEEVKQCSVTTFLEDDDGTTASIQRARPSSLKFWIDGVERTALDPSATQEDILRFLGLDRDVFHASVFFAQTDLLHFADVGEAKRLELLSKIIPELAAVDGLLEKAKADRDGHQASVVKLMAARDKALGQVEALEGIDYAQKQAHWERERQNEVTTLISGRAAQIAYIEAHQGPAATIPSLEVEYAALSAQGSGVKPEIGFAFRDAEHLAVLAQTKLGISRAERQRLQKVLQKMRKTTTGSCSECGQEVTQVHLDREVSRVGVQVRNELLKEEGFDRAYAACRGSVDSLRAADEQVQEEWLQKVETHALALRVRQGRLTELRQLQHYLDIAAQESANCDARLGALHAQVNPFLAEAQKLKRKQREAFLNVNSANEAVTKTKLALVHSEFWVKAFGPKGLKNYILDSKLQEMTDAVNHWVKLLTGGTFWLRFETQKKGRSSKKISNEFNIKVFRYNPDGRISERNYKSWSGGEKGRVSLAIDVGLSRLIATRALKSYDLLVLDELFKHVDKAGGEAIAEMLGELKREKSSLFVIEHDSDFGSLFENQVLVRRENARSTIVEVASGDERVSGDRQETQPAKAKPKRKARRARVSNRSSM